MSVNNVKKLSSLASGNVKKFKKNGKIIENKPIKLNKVEEDEKKSLSEKFNEAVTAGLSSLEQNSDNIGAQVLEESVKTTALESSPKLSKATAEISESGKKIESSDDLIEALENIETSFNGVTDYDYVPDEYKIKMPDSLDLEKLEVPEIDENKILKEVTAEEELNTKKAKESEINKTNSAIDALLGSIESAKEGAAETDAKINQIYDDYKLTQESEAIKRGLARSSVAILALDGIEKSRAAELSDAAKELNNEIMATEKEISSLQASLTQALENLDLELSVNINNAMEEKIAELNKKRSEAIEFNNNVQKLEAEYQQKRLTNVDDARELESYLMEKYEGSALEDKTQQMYDIAYDYFKGLDQTSALRELISNSKYAELLGEKYYDLYYAIMRKK